MSDRFYTTLEVRGPNATSAEKAAIEALKAIPPTEGVWIENRQPGVCVSCGQQRPGSLPPCFFDHDSGNAAIVVLKSLSLKFPTETFFLHVDGGAFEGVQGLVDITNGLVKDGREPDE